MVIYNEGLSDYITRNFAQQDTHLLQTLGSLEQNSLPTINVKAEEGRFLQFLVCTSQPKKALEIGTLGGYSSIWIARGLPADGRLITLEREIDHARVASQNFSMAGLDDRIEIRVGDAHQLLQELTHEGPFDFVFIDAEKTGYNHYLDWAVTNVRVGGVIAAHNAFRQGAILKQPPDEEAQVMLEFNRRVAADQRLCSTIFPAGDGMVVAVRVV